VLSTFSANASIAAAGGRQGFARGLRADANITLKVASQIPPEFH
jgi:hypothetical protein